jgi:ribosomal protein S1
MELKEGDKIESVVLSVENDRGQVMLSVKQAAQDAKWDFFKKAIEDETIFEAQGIEVNKGG